MFALVRGAVGAVLATLVVATLPASAAALQDFGSRTPDQHVYDRSGTMTPAQVSDLGARATALDRAGAPTIVYLRPQAADQASTRRDAGELMDAWQVESAAGAKDGLVFFVNLRPGDTQHGSAALYAGSAHVDDGRLSAARLQDIFDHSMRPLLAEGDVAGGLAAGLEAARVDLGKPPPSSSGQGDWFVTLTLFMVGAGSLFGIALFFAFAVWGFASVARRGSGWGGGYTGSAGSSWTNSGGSGSSSGDSGSGGGGGGGGGDSSSGGSSGGGSF
jgi:uncharacterized membrane protein YgcG